MTELKALPFSEAIEECVLGALLIDGGSINDISDLIKAELFYKEKNRKIYEAMDRLYKKGMDIDLLTVCADLKSCNQLDMCGGYQRISLLATKIATSAHIETHIQLLAEKHIRREIIKNSRISIEKAYGETEELDEVLENYQTQALNLGVNFLRTKELSIKEIAKEFLRNVESENKPNHYVPIHIVQIQEETNGFGGGEMILLAGRPGMGKTALALDLLYEQAKLGYKVVFYSLEMSKEELIMRLCARITNIAMVKLKSNNLTPHEKKLIQEFYNEIKHLPIYIESPAILKINDLKSKARRMKGNMNIDIIYIDYLQLIQGDKRLFNQGERYVGDISKQIKSIALELNIPIVALSQLSRKIEERKPLDQFPIMSDLRDSGSLEQDASMILFPTRLKKLGLENFDGFDDIETAAIIDLAKNRNGAPVKAKCKVSKNVAKWETYTQNDLPF